jgi:hypothetical protein
MEHPTFSHGHCHVLSEVAALHCNAVPLNRLAHCKPMSSRHLLEIFGSIFGDNKSRHTQVNKILYITKILITGNIINTFNI